MILAGDIGGTNTRLGLFDPASTPLRPRAADTFPSKEHDSLDAIVLKFLGKHPTALARACFAIAGPVRDGRVATTNLAWTVDAARLAQQHRLERVDLINDLEAIGHGLPHLAPEDLATLRPGAPGASGNRAIIAAGTGLGEAGCYWDGRSHRPFATEGGHADFAARNALEFELLGHLMKKYQRVSYERIVSGSGLLEIYRFLRHTGRGEEDPALAETIDQQAHPAPIVRAALEGRSARCAQALELFVSIFGAEAGNLGLKLMARGGIFVAGGIAPRILERLRTPSFLDALTAKGRMKPLLESMPVHVVLNDQVGLIGAAQFAAAAR